MASVTYDAFVDRMIQKYEGGYGWNRSDPGGPTKYGVTCYDLAQHMGQKMDSMARWAPIVQAMTLATAEQIYKTKYATAVRYDDLPAGVDACMLDYGVNSGTGRPILAARAILGVKGGATMDAALLAALQKTDAVAFIKALDAERLHFMRQIRTWPTFGGGWTSRVNDLNAYCLHLAAGGSHVTAPVAADLAHVAMPKAIHVGQTAPGKTAAGTVTTGASAAALGFPWYVVGGVVLATIIAGVTYEAISANTAANANTTVVLPPGVVLPTVPAVPAVAIAA